MTSSTMSKYLQLYHDKYISAEIRTQIKRSSCFADLIEQNWLKINLELFIYSYTDVTLRYMCYHCPNVFQYHVNTLVDK